MNEKKPELFEAPLGTNEPEKPKTFKPTQELPEGKKRRPPVEVAPQAKEHHRNLVITEMSWKNYGCLTFEEKIRIDGKNAFFVGQSGIGKTSVALLLLKAITTSGTIIKTGEKRGFIKCLLGEEYQAPGEIPREISVKRTSEWDDEKQKQIERVTIVDNAGTFRNMSDIVAIVSKIAVNPLSPVFALDNRQEKTVVRLLKNAIIPEDIGYEIEDLLILLGRANEKKNRWTAEVKKEGEIILPEKVEPVDVGGTSDQIKEIEADHVRITEIENSIIPIEAKKEKALSKVIDLEDDIGERAEKIDQLKAEIKELEALQVDWELQVKSQNEHIEGIDKEIDLVEESLKEPENQKQQPRLDELYKTLSKANETNENATKYNVAVEKLARKNKKKSILARCDRRHKDLEALKSRAIHKATWPIPEMGIVNGLISYRGIPFTDCSGSEGDLLKSVLAALEMKRELDSGSSRLANVFYDGVESMSEEHLQESIALFNSLGIRVIMAQMKNDGSEVFTCEIEDLRSPTQEEIENRTE